MAYIQNPRYQLQIPSTVDYREGRKLSRPPTSFARDIHGPTIGVTLGGLKNGRPRVVPKKSIQMERVPYYSASA